MMRPLRARLTARLPRLLVGAALLTGVLAAPAAAGGTTRFVDDDGKAGPGCSGNGMAFEEIQLAVDASSPGDTVRVCPGTYLGAIAITVKNLTIEATSPGDATVTIAETVTTAGDLKELPLSPPLIEIIDGDDVTLDGLVLRIPAPEVLSAGPEVECRLEAAILVRANSDRVAILRNRMRAVGPDTLGPCGYEQGIEFRGGSSGRAVGNVIRDFAGEGIVGIGASTLLTMRKNDIRFWHDHEWDVKPAGGPGGCTYGAGLVLLDGARGLIEDNVIVGRATASVSSPAICPGIYLEGAGDGIIVRENLVRYAYDGINTASTSDFLVEDNRFLDSRNDGILIPGSADSRVRDNIVRRSWARGIHVPGENDVLDTARTSRGYRAVTPGGLPSGSNVTFRRNGSFDNDGRDCRDDTVGGRTLGTANTWIDNVSDANDKPNGICP